MSEAWPYLLIVGYVIALIFSAFKQKTLFREEIKFFCFYLLAGLAAAVWARDIQEIYINPPCQDCPRFDINSKWMFREYWRTFIIPFLKAFAVLSLIRLPLLLLTNRKRKIDAHRNEA